MSTRPVSEDGHRYWFGQWPDMPWKHDPLDEPEDGADVWPDDGHPVEEEPEVCES